MSKRDHAKSGTRDYCRFCGGTIQLGSTGSSYRWLNWVHILPEDEERPQVCRDLSYGPNERARYNTAKPKTFCAENVHTSWSSNLCNRPVKDDELFMCGIHANHERKRRKKDEERDSHYELQRFIQENVAKLCTQLEEEWGLEASSHYQYNWGGGMGSYTGKVLVDPEALLKLLDDLGNMEEL